MLASRQRTVNNCARRVNWLLLNKKFSRSKPNTERHASHYLFFRSILTELVRYIIIYPTENELTAGTKFDFYVIVSAKQFLASEYEIKNVCAVDRKCKYLQNL